MALKNILFLCRDNAAVSIMAEAYMKVAGRGVAHAYSAGCHPAEAVHSIVLKTIWDAGVRHGGLMPKSWNVFTLARAPSIDLVVYLCDPLTMGPAPVWPGKPGKIVLKPSCSNADDLKRMRPYEALEAFAEIRTLADSLLIDMREVAA